MICDDERHDLDDSHNTPEEDEAEMSTDTL